MLNFSINFQTVDLNHAKLTNMITVVGCKKEIRFVSKTQVFYSVDYSVDSIVNAQQGLNIVKSGIFFDFS